MGPISREDCRKLHEKGVLELKGGLPEWEVFTYVEQKHAKLHERIVALLERTRGTWKHDGDRRPGTAAAREVTEALKGKGIYVSAVHPCAPDDADDQSGDDYYTGPRFYVSMMEGFMRSGSAPQPPRELQRLLWPTAAARRRPRITELGWTAVPPNMEPQVLHADIASWKDPTPLARMEGRGRFHHFIWKPDRKSLCTTRVVPGAFTEGVVEDWHYGAVFQVKSPTIVLDSEVLHSGNVTGPGAWSSSLTVQLCSTEGWDALNIGGRASQELLRFVCPISAPPESEEDEAKAQVAPAVPGDGWRPGDEVQARWEGAWLPACLARRQPAAKAGAGFWRVLWEGEGTFSDLPVGDLRPRPGKRCRRSAADEAARAAVGDGAQPPRKRAKGQASEAVDESSELGLRGFLPLPGGLPWRWAPFDFVEACHARFASRVEQELEALREAWTPLRLGVRPGAFAAAKVNERMARFGIAVYAGPPCEGGLEEDYEIKGPRFYVSLTKRWLARFGEELPPMPEGLQRLLWPQEAERAGQHRVRGLGWALAPPQSWPQQLHADLWGDRSHERGASQVRFPHILWKRSGALCTTEVVPGGFTHGQADAEHYELVESAKAPAIIVDGEVLHRGGATPSAARSGAAGGSGWVSSCSIEMCSASGWRAWQAGTMGTVADPDDPEWRMLLIAQKRTSSKDEDDAEAEAKALESKWREALSEEQRLWEETGEA